MEEIKRRISAVGLVLNGKVTTSFQYANMEFVALQFRMVFELIVLARLAAHRHLFEKMSRRLAKEWQIGPVVAEVRKRNPGFYPKPVRRVPSEKPGIQDDWLDTAVDFLKIDELIEAHGKLGKHPRCMLEIELPLPQRPFALCGIVGYSHPSLD